MAKEFFNIQDEGSTVKEMRKWACDHEVLWPYHSIPTKAVSLIECDEMAFERCSYNMGWGMQYILNQQPLLERLQRSKGKQFRKRSDEPLESLCLLSPHL